MITELKENQIFIFGSNLAGKHVGGAALQAKEEFGAEEGVGEGLTGQCYAFPTLNEKNKKRTKQELEESIKKLWICCVSYFGEKEFLLTKVGCGIAGYKESYIKALFRGFPRNLIKPKDWQ